MNYQGNLVTTCLLGVLKGIFFERLDNTTFQSFGGKLIFIHTLTFITNYKSMRSRSSVG